MFTSRAEYRLLLRVDNADMRLTPKGRQAGLVDDSRWESFQARKGRFDVNMGRVRGESVRDESGARVPAEQWLRQPSSSLAKLAEQGFALAEPLSRLDIPSVETTLKYDGYLKRQESDIRRRSREEHRRIPQHFQYSTVPGLSSEAVHRLNQVKPETIGQATRIPGLTPAAIAVLSTYVSRADLSKIPGAPAHTLDRLTE
jgi:tRNA uridine 5-carboxymethylaminomethyl modification enzyme